MLSREKRIRLRMRFAVLKKVGFLLGEEVRPIQPGVRERSRAVIRTFSLAGYPRKGRLLPRLTADELMTRFGGNYS